MYTKIRNSLIRKSIVCWQYILYHIGLAFYTGNKGKIHETCLFLYSGQVCFRSACIVSWNICSLILEIEINLLMNWYAYSRYVWTQFRATMIMNWWWNLTYFSTVFTCIPDRIYLEIWSVQGSSKLSVP